MRTLRGILDAKLDFSDEGVFARLGERAVSRLSAAMAWTFVLAPLFGAVRGVLHPQAAVKTLLIEYPALIRSCVWPLAALLAAATLVLAWGRARRAGEGGFWRENPVFGCFLALVAWMLLATLASGLSAAALVGSGLHYETIFMQLGYFLLLFPAATRLTDAAVKRRLARAQECVSLVLVAAAFVLWMAQVKADVMWFGFSAVFSNINYYGYYLAVSVPLAAAMFVAEEQAAWKALSALTVAANTVALAYNNTMGAWVACAAAMFFLLAARGILTRRLDREALCMALLFALCLYLTGHLRGNFESNTMQLGADIAKVVTNAEGAEYAGSRRWIIWQRGVALLRAHPVFGIGFEGIDARGLLAYALNNRVHNEYLQYALFYGLPAGALYFIGCFGVYLRALRLRETLDGVTLACLTAAFGYLVSAFFGITLFGTTPYLFLFLGMGYAHAPKRGGGAGFASL